MTLLLKVMMELTSAQVQFKEQLYVSKLQLGHAQVRNLRQLLHKMELFQ